MRKPLRGWLSSFCKVSTRNPRRLVQVELLNHLCFRRGAFEVVYLLAVARIGRQRAHEGYVSDGIHSFFSAKPSIDGKRVEAIPMVEALNELWSFKNSHGAFVSRRVNKFKKDCRAKEWRHADDLAFGALYL